VALDGTVSAVRDLLVDRDAIQCGRSGTALFWSLICLLTKSTGQISPSPTVRLTKLGVCGCVEDDALYVELFRTMERNERSAERGRRALWWAKVKYRRADNDLI
jgi:hypothetical protein